MTIYTGEVAVSPEKKELIDDSLDVEVQCTDDLESKALTKEEPADYEYRVYNDPVVPIRFQPRPVPRSRICLQLCLFLGMLAGITVSVLASLYLYKTMTSSVRYRGRCGVGVVDLPRYNMSAPSKAAALKSAATARSPVRSSVMEDVDIDGQMETIHVPEYGGFMDATFKHDFGRNVTALRDDVSSLCYLLPLLYGSLIPEPATFSSDLKSQDGTYGDVPAVTYQYFVKSGGHEYYTSGDLNELCGDYKTYVANPDSVAATTPGRAHVSSTESLEATIDKMFRMFAGGDAAINYHIISADDIYDYQLI